MDEWGAVGKLLIAAGCGLVAVGLLFVLSDRIPGLGGWFGWIGKLPGDLSIKRDSFSLFAPLGTSLVLSIGLSLLFYFLSWLFKR
ncbi:MAG: hypothetical protein LZF86_110507 [Nitrospira sp.]|nr:MAG: hypothetical protein LZF86_110507 [Nitrospira sp.]